MAHVKDLDTGQEQMLALSKGSIAPVVIPWETQGGPGVGPCLSKAAAPKHPNPRYGTVQTPPPAAKAPTVKPPAAAKAPTVRSPPSAKAPTVRSPSVAKAPLTHVQEETESSEATTNMIEASCDFLGYENFRRQLVTRTFRSWVAGNPVDLDTLSECEVAAFSMMVGGYQGEMRRGIDLRWPDRMLGERVGTDHGGGYQPRTMKVQSIGKTAEANMAVLTGFPNPRVRVDSGAMDLPYTAARRLLSPWPLEMW